MGELAYREVYAMNKIEARKRLIKTYEQTGSIRATARIWNTSPQVVRKWVRRYQKEGENGLKDRSRRPHNIPRQTPPEIEEKVVEARKKTGYGPKRLSLWLQRQGVHISPHTIRHILDRKGLTNHSRKRRRPLYPAHWAWEEDQPLSFFQVDVKDILDKQALGTSLWQHFRRLRLPRYQFTFCDARTRLRFILFADHLNRTNALAAMIIVLLWLRAFGVQNQVIFQTDWGQEFGGDNPDQIAALEKRFLAPLQAKLVRYPLGRKQYNGRVERSHRADDEEFYRPYLLSIQNRNHFLEMAARWIYFYNVLRPHLGAGMDGRTPIEVLYHLGYNGESQIALLPPIILDPISADLLLACDSEVGNDLLAQYSQAQWGCSYSANVVSYPRPGELSASNLEQFYATH